MLKKIIFSLSLISAISVNCMETNKAKDIASKEITISNNGRFISVPKEIILEIIKFAFLLSENETELKQTIGRLPRLNIFFNALFGKDPSAKMLWQNAFNGLNQIKANFYNSPFNDTDLDRLNKDALVPQLRSNLKSKLLEFAKKKYNNLLRFQEQNQNDKNKMLFVAAKIGNLDLAILALSKGADINAKNEDDGWTALMVAARDGYKEIMELLISKGADINAENPYGKTALALAAMNGSKDVVELLMAKGAGTKDEYVNTALMVAEYFDHKEIVELLEKAQKTLSDKKDVGSSYQSYKN